MGSISNMFNIGTRSMSATKSGLQTTSHNIANTNTPGYSVQRAELKTADPYTFGTLRIGTGVNVGGITRAHSEFLQRQLVEASADAGKYRQAAVAATEVENIVNEAVHEKLNKGLSEFFNSFRDLSQDATSEALRKTVIENANGLVRNIRDVDNSLYEIRDSIDFRIKQNVEHVNELLVRIGSLNQTIANLKASKMRPNDEMDQRDLALRELAQIVDIRSNEDDKGYLYINLGGKMPLITGASIMKLSANPAPADLPGEGTKLEGSVEIYSETPGGSLRPIRYALTGGELAGLIQVRDQLLPQVKDRLDLLVHTFTTNVNAVHRQGFARDGLSGRNLFSGTNASQPTLEGGMRPPASETGETPAAVAGVPAWKDAMARVGLALSLRDTDQLASAIEPGKLGDNRLALAIAAIERERLLDNNSVTLGDHYAATLGELGTMTRSFNNFSEHYDGILRQLKNYHESVVGVSLDEEAVRMVELQHQFNASAKMIRTADELLQTVMTLKS